MGSANMDIDTDDISDDLYSDIFIAPTKKTKVEDSIASERYQTLLKENQTLKEQVKRLEKENKNYATNISSLYLTARSEIDKKNYIIKSLSERLKSLTQFKSQLSSGETQKLISQCQGALMESQNQVTLQEIKKSIKALKTPDEPGRRKRIRFGNMSFYYFRDQTGFQRDEPVTFPPPPSKKRKKEPEGDREIRDPERDHHNSHQQNTDDRKTRSHQTDDSKTRSHQTDDSKTRTHQTYDIKTRTHQTDDRKTRAHRIDDRNNRDRNHTDDRINRRHRR